MTSPTRRALVLASVLVLVIAVLLPSRDISVAPAWKVFVLDAEGRPLREVEVRESWRHSLLERAYQEDIAVTDGAGGVLFPSRSVRASRAAVWLGAVRAFFRSSIDASYGPEAFVEVDRVSPSTGVFAGASMREATRIGDRLESRLVVIPVQRVLTPSQ